MLLSNTMKNSASIQSHSVVLIYANSSPSIGNGHVLRQLALAQALKKNSYHVSFIYQQMTVNIKQQLLNSNFACQQLGTRSINHYVQAYNASLLVIDDYHLTLTEKHNLTNCTADIVVFDDNTDNELIVADIIINAADDATAQDYHARSSQPTLLLGAKFRLIRAEFQTQRHLLKNKQARTRLMITMGGSDVANFTYPITQALLSYDPRLPLDIVIANMNHTDEVALLALIKQHKNCRLHKNVTNMAPLMAEAKMAITAAGGTLYELATLGTPSVGLCVSKNQLSAMNSPMFNLGFLAFDCAEPSSNKPLVSILQAATTLWLATEQRQDMADNLFNHFDGQGADRIVSIINKLRR